MRLLRAVQLGAGFLLFLQAIPANAGLIDFEGLPDSTIITNQYSGLAFANAIILTAGISLNEIDFPPRSGVNVVSDDNGPLSIAFASPVTNFGAYFTYAVPLTLTAFDSLNNLVATSTSAFSANYASSGHTPNEFLHFTLAGGISRMTITGDPAGSSFVLDDLTTTTGTAVPEPASWVLVITIMSLVALVTMARKIRQP